MKETSEFNKTTIDAKEQQAIYENKSDIITKNDLTASSKQSNKISKIDVSAFESIVTDQPRLQTIQVTNNPTEKSYTIKQKVIYSRKSEDSNN